MVSRVDGVGLHAIAASRAAGCFSHCKANGSGAGEPFEGLSGGGERTGEAVDRKARGGGERTWAFFSPWGRSCFVGRGTFCAPTL